jgi:predicted Zn-dependent protease
VQEGYSPAGIIRLMQRFEKLEAQSQQQSPGSPIGEIAKLPLGALQEYFRLHPPASERIAGLDMEIRARNWNESAPVRPSQSKKISKPARNRHARTTPHRAPFAYGVLGFSMTCWVCTENSWKSEKVWPMIMRRLP